MKPTLFRLLAIASAILVAWVFWPREIVVSVTSATGERVAFELRSVGAMPGVYNGVTPAVLRLRTGGPVPTVLEIETTTGEARNPVFAAAAPGEPIDVRLEVGSRSAFVRGPGVLLQVDPVSIAARTSPH